MIFLVFATAVQAQTPPGTVIRNGATVTYQAETGAVFDPVSDSSFVTVGSPAGIAITLSKAADRATGTLGDVLTYTIAYQGLAGESGGSPGSIATGVVLTDPLPAGATYVAGTLALNGTALTDATGDDAGSFDAVSRRVSVTLPNVTGSSSGVITFRARLDGTVSPSNIARVAYTTPYGPDSAASNPALTTLVFAGLSLNVLLDAPAPGVPARAGSPVHYRVHYVNPANGVIARNVVVTDTLPPELEYVGSIPLSQAAVPRAPPTVAGAVLTWTIGDIAPGTAGDLVIQTAVAATLPDSATVINRVWVNLANGPPVTGPSPPLLLLPTAGQLSLVQTADVLAVGVGQTVPYTLALENLGVGPLADIRIVVSLPEGARYTPNSALGADSVVLNGQEVTFYVAGPLAGGTTHNVRYQVAIVTAGAEVLQSSAVAYAEGGTVVSTQAAAWVNVQPTAPLETRAVIGKVFADANANGRQEVGELGVEGVDVWTDDGEIATTDADGRFSFDNMRPGRHVYRVDPTTLPAGARVPDPAQARDGSGWTTPRVSFALRTAAAGSAAANGGNNGNNGHNGNNGQNGHNGNNGQDGEDGETALFVPALRDSTARAREARRALTAGPAVTVFAPRDGSILSTDRVFVGVTGEPGARVELFDGARRIGNGKVRGDGIHDFIGVALTPGPHRLRVIMKNSWGQERWDSLTVHVSGRPANFVYDGSKVVLTVDQQRLDTVYIHVFDQWNVPVITGALVTASADGAEIVNDDADGSSAGLQVRADSSGVLTLALRGGHDVRVGSLTLRSDSAITRVPAEILPAARPFMLTATGQVGVGASPDAFGAATARGRLDQRTSVLVSVDSRQLDAGAENFGRAVDPLGDAQYPILGDAARRQTRSPSRYAVAARVERGLDWLAFGDLTTGSFAGGLTLSGYDRALAGVAGRVTTGPVVWQGFGASSSDRLVQRQVRGAGMSGPYDVGVGITPGTERVVLETRSFDDAQQMLARQVLTRFIDYQIDYERGLVLFKQPVPAADPSGNPVFIMITYGTEDGGAQSTVWGVRATADARELVNVRGSLDSLRIGSTFIRDGRPGAKRELTGVDFGALRVGRVALRGELAHSQTPDSAGSAMSLGGLIMFSKGFSVSGDWLRTDAEFHNPANIALVGGTRDFKIGARFEAGGTELRLEHSAQTFDQQDVSRAKSGAFVGQRFGNTLRAQVGVSASRLNTGAGLSDERAQASELRLMWSPIRALTFTAESRQHLGEDFSPVQPDYIGGGVTFKASARTSFELSHRQVELPGGLDYAVTSLGGRSDIGAGTQAWGSYQIAGANGGQVAAVMGLNNRLRFGPAWTLSTLFERRFGLNDAPSVDPVRALPFTQTEEDYWSAGLGAEYLPEHAPYRLSLRGEVRDGTERSSRLFTLAGAADLTASFALITRQEFQGADDRLSTGRVERQRISSINGVAFRPVGSDALNFLAKVQVVDERNPLGGGVLTGQGAGHEARRIYMTEAIWSPRGWFEFGARYALRNADATVTHPDSVVQSLRSSADYIGSRLEIGLARWLRVRGDGRLLHERTTRTTQWDAAPQLVIVPVRGIEIANGYRWGDLRDPDFSVRGGEGWFMTIGATITEQSLSSIGGFWRSREGR